MAPGNKEILKDQDFTPKMELNPKKKRAGFFG